MDEVVYWYALCTVVLFFKMFAISGYQAFYRIGSGHFKVPEDARFLGKTPVAEEVSQVQRGARAWLNDLENIPIFLALGVVYIWVEASATAAPWLFLTFTGARVIHTLCYLTGLQPWRTLAYGVAILCLFAMSILILLAL